MPQTIRTNRFKYKVDVNPIAKIAAYTEVSRIKNIRFA